MEITINMKVEINEEIVLAIIDGALFGMYGWAEGMYIKDNGNFINPEDKNIAVSEKYTKILMSNGSLEIVEFDYNYDDKKVRKHELNLSKLCNGIKIVLEKYNHLADINKLEYVDSMSADAIIQCAIFGDIIYG